MAVLGFAFWMVARLYSTSDVGLGSALISAVGFLSLLSGKFSAKLVASSPGLQGEKAIVEGFASIAYSSRREGGNGFKPREIDISRSLPLFPFHVGGANKTDILGCR